MKVIVGISGGVDSAIAAYMLKKQGYEVIGVNLSFCDINNASEEKNIRDLGEKLEIEIKNEDYTEEFKNSVIKYFVSEYKKGFTPNPCAYCNGNMKFKKLYEVMQKYNADAISTGHYATCEKSDRYYIKRSRNLQKDQSYMLCYLTQDVLSHLMLPIGDMDKSEVRDIAKKIGLGISDKKDSQDVCFIPDKDYIEYIKKYDFGDDYKEKVASGKLKEMEVLSKPYLKKGEFVNKQGEVLGYHNGIINYTIGQRKGLNIAFGERKFVLSIDAKNNRVVLGDNDELFSTEFKVRDVVYQKEILKEGEIEKDVIAKLRYRHEGTVCQIKKESDGTLVCNLKEPVRAITRGQAAVFYDSDFCILYSGVIDF